MASSMDEVSKELKDKQRRQRAREQLLKVNQKKKEEKIAAHQNELDGLLQLLEHQTTFDPEEYQMMLEDAGFDSSEGLQKAVSLTQASLETEQTKLADLVRSLAGGGVEAVEEKMPEEYLHSLRERRKVCVWVGGGGVGIWVGEGCVSGWGD